MYKSNFFLLTVLKHKSKALQIQTAAPTEQKQAVVSRLFRHSEDSVPLQNTLKFTHEHCCMFDIAVNSVLLLSLLLPCENRENVYIFSDLSILQGINVIDKMLW